jgi:predicted amidohydrolase
MRARERHDEASSRTRVATVHPLSTPGDAYNSRVRHFVTEAARSGVEIIAFPEMCLTGYRPCASSTEAVDALAEPVPDGPCTQERCASRITDDYQLAHRAR